MRENTIKRNEIIKDAQARDKLLTCYVIDIDSRNHTCLLYRAHDVPPKLLFVLFRTATKKDVLYRVEIVQLKRFSELTDGDVASIFSKPYRDWVACLQDMRQIHKHFSDDEIVALVWLGEPESNWGITSE